MSRTKKDAAIIVTPRRYKDPTQKFFIGVNQATAKVACFRPLQPPIIISDSYSGTFAFYNSPGQKWGIIEVDFNLLRSEALYPFHGYIERVNRSKAIGNNRRLIERRRHECLASLTKFKTSWQKSLDNCGSFIYNYPLDPTAIKKISIYNPSSNQFITENFLKVDPYEILPKYHRKNLPKYTALAAWLNCETVQSSSWMPDANYNELDRVNEKLAQREGLDLFYLRNENKKGKIIDI